jgi:hypothetical protein
MPLAAILACDMGNGSDRPAVLTTKCVQLYFGMSWMRFDRSKRGLLAADVACFRDDVFDPHIISFRPSGGEGDGRPFLIYEVEIEPGRLVNGGTVDCSVRLPLTNSESN